MNNTNSLELAKAAAERAATHIQQRESLRKIADQCIRSTTTRTAAARQFVEIMAKGFNEPKTPAGDRYTQHAVKIAMRTSSAVAGADLLPAEIPVAKPNRTWCLK